MSENAERNLSDDFFRKFLLTFSGFFISAEFRKNIFKKVYRREVPNRFLMSSESCIQNLSDHFFRICISAKFVFPRKCISAEMGCGIKKMCTGEMFEIDFLYHQNLIHKICQMTFYFFYHFREMYISAEMTSISAEIASISADIVCFCGSEIGCGYFDMRGS